MYLYNLTLQKSGAITHAIYGSFSGNGLHEFVVSRGKILELLRPDESGKLQSVFSVEVFGIIRSLLAFRLTGSKRDYIVVGTDSGKITILEFSAAKNRFVRVHQELFGKSGCRRVVPGQYLAADPKGRAVMIAAVEKQKFVYVLNRDPSNRLTISSPLEAHKSHNIVFATVGLDNGFENPLFATLEVDYEDIEKVDLAADPTAMQKHVVYYELELGLNTVKRVWSDRVDADASHLIAVPGGDDGPGGVLVCSENFVVYKHQDKGEVRVIIPRRYDMSADRGLMIVASTTFRRPGLFFFLLQSEYGDLYKVELTISEDRSAVTDITMQYFDTVPVANSICMTRTGYLFVGAEFGNHKFYRFVDIGDESSSDVYMVDIETGEEGQTTQVPTFKPRALKFLELVDDLDSLSPVLDFKVQNLFKDREETPQIYCLCGRGARSSLRILRHGLSVTTLANSELPGNAIAVWTTKRSARDEFDQYIVVSFASVTLVLSIGETVEEVTDSGLLAGTSTLCTHLVGEDSLVQVHSGGVRQIRADKRIQEWKTSGKRTITKAAVNDRQVIIALSGGEIVYFEIDETGTLQEFERKDMGTDIASIDIGEVPSELKRCNFAAVGFYDTNNLRILSLDPSNCLATLSTQALKSIPHSLSIVEMQSGSTEGAGSGDRASTAPTALFLHVGLENGVLLRSVLDSTTGKISDTRTRFLGTRAVKLMRTRVRGQQACLALSSRSWLCYTYQSRFYTTPLSHEPFDFASSFCSEQCPEGLVAVAANSLQILNIERYGYEFNQTSVGLKATPRKFAVHPTTNHLVIIETDHNAFTEFEKEEIRKELHDQDRERRAKVKAEQQGGMEVEGGGARVKLEGEVLQEDEEEDRDEAAELPEADFGTMKAGAGKWASYVRIYDVEEDTSHDIVELGNNEAAFTMALCSFPNSAFRDETFLIVGTAKDMRLYPRGHSGGYLHCYRFTEEGKRIELLHKTPLDDVPTALCAFQGRLLVGMGPVLRIYDIGKKKMLRKCENKNFPNMITGLSSMGDRIYVSDVTESVHFVKYHRADNSLTIFADDTAPRWITSMSVLDYDTIAAGDKFGNVFVSRLTGRDGQVDEADDVVGHNLWDRGLLNGAPHKAEEIAQFHVGETVTSIQRASLIPGGLEALFYVTTMGSLGALLPFTSKLDYDFFAELEAHLRQENPPLLGREHAVFRSSFFPVKDVIDGDFCEQLVLMEHEKQRSISYSVGERTPNEVAKKLEDMRNKLL